MKRRDYQKPTMKVVVLQQKSHLLQVSGGLNAKRGSYSLGRSDGGNVSEDEVWE